MSRREDDEITGDVGTVISGNTGPIALNGDINQNTTVVITNQDGLTVIEGDNHGGIGRTFGGKKKRR